MTKPRKLSSGRWQARYPVTEGGTTRQVSAGTYATRKEAQDAAHTELVKRRAGEWIDPSNRKTTVSEWAEQWYSLRRTPCRKTRSFLSNHVVPRWGSLRLDEVTTLALQQWFNDLSKTLSPATVRGIHATVRGMYARAVDYDMIAKNPCRGIDLPAERELDIVALSVEQIALLEEKAPDRFKAMVHLAAWGGLRWGECAALRWEDVDLESGVVHVRRGMKDNGVIGTTKNGKSRKVLISAASVEVLRRHRRDFGSTELLFTTSRGAKPLTATNFRSNEWKRTVDAAGLDPKPTYHDLRHFHATVLVTQGVDWKIIADRLGHHKPSFTMDRYGSLRPDRNEVLLAALGAAMRPDVQADAAP